MNTEIIKDKTFKDLVKEHFEEEKNNGIEGYERFKIACVESVTELIKD